MSLSGGDHEALQRKLDWLRPPPDTGRTSADIDLFRAAGVTPPRKTQ